MIKHPILSAIWTNNNTKVFFSYLAYLEISLHNKYGTSYDLFLDKLQDGF